MRRLSSRLAACRLGAQMSEARTSERAAVRAAGGASVITKVHLPAAPRKQKSVTRGGKQLAVRGVGNGESQRYG